MSPSMRSAHFVMITGKLVDIPCGCVSRLSWFGNLNRIFLHSTKSIIGSLQIFLKLYLLEARKHEHKFGYKHGDTSNFKKIITSNGQYNIGMTRV